MTWSINGGEKNWQVEINRKILNRFPYVLGGCRKAATHAVTRNDPPALHVLNFHVSRATTTTLARHPCQATC